MKVTFVATVLNEEASIGGFLDSLAKQTRHPDEIIIVDGGSTDATTSVISKITFGKLSASKFKISNFKIRLIKKRGNRAVGRNEAIRLAKNDIIACSDAGCILDIYWLERIVEPFKDPRVDVVAGFYKGAPQNIFQKCLVPYVLVMPNRVNPDDFLPATRSMAMRKSVWRQTGGFPEEFSLNEDYVFSRKLKDMGKNIKFVKEAIVYWVPRKNLYESFVMFYCFAKGDIQAGILRPKVIALFMRYLMGLLLFMFFLPALCLFLFLYIAWAIVKNYRYAHDWRAIVLLPLLQLTADIAVIAGSIAGISRRRYGIF